MRIISQSTLRKFYEKHPQAKAPLTTWAQTTKRAAWKNMIDVKNDFGSADPIDSERVVFNIGGNNYRLVAKVWFGGQMVFVKFLGTHEEYDKIDVTKLA